MEKIVEKFSFASKPRCLICEPTQELRPQKYKFEVIINASELEEGDILYINHNNIDSPSFKDIVIIMKTGSSDNILTAVNYNLLCGDCSSSNCTYTLDELFLNRDFVLKISNIYFPNFLSLINDYCC